MKKKLEYFNRLEIFRNSLPDLSSYEIEKLTENTTLNNIFPKKLYMGSDFFYFKKKKVFFKIKISFCNFKIIKF